MDDDLTKDADVLICVLYERYLNEREKGTEKLRAKMFGASDTIRMNLMPQWSLQTVDETCHELSRAGYLTCMFSANTIYNCRLSDKGVVYMENRFPKGLTQLIKFLKLLKDINPLT